MFDAGAQQQFLDAVLFQSFGKELKAKSFTFLVGGNINNALKIQSEEGSFFLKWNVHSLEGMFECEAKSLHLLASMGVKVPEVLGYGKYEDKSYLLLEFVSSGRESEDYWQHLGSTLAHLHQQQNEQHGLNFDNYIGSLPQSNTPQADGIEFLITQRLRPQAGKALYEHKLSRETYQALEKLYQKLPDIIPDEPACLLHGDLWKGNVMPTDEEQALLIDPAIYYGYREMEMAFTQLFGGFSSTFYDAYQADYPLQPGFAERAEIYNLYPLLVHTNLFGEAYLAGVKRTLARFL